MDRILRKGKIAALFVFLFCFLIFGSIGITHACVGRTIYIGYFQDEPEQAMIARLLEILIDERTGTSVKLVLLKDREEAYKLLKRDKISIFVEYPGKVLQYYERNLGQLENTSDFDSQKAKLGSDLKVIFVTAPGFDSTVSGKNGKRNLGKAHIVLSKKALSRFPALPRLLKKLSGIIDNETMSHLILNGIGGSAKEITRNFLKKNKLI